MKKLLFLLFTLSSLLTKAQNVQIQYKIFDVKNEKLISIDNLVKDVSNADVIFFGEEHNDSIGHYLELGLFQKLAAAYPRKTALALEMFHTDVQHIVNEYLWGEISEKSFIKEARAWNNQEEVTERLETVTVA